MQVDDDLSAAEDSKRKPKEKEDMFIFDRRRL